MRDILMERYLINSEWCEEVKRFNTECTEEKRRTQRKRERSFDRLGAKAPASLRKITQGRQDDDAHRIVRDAEGAEKDQGESATMLTLWQAGAQQAAPLPLDWRARWRSMAVPSRSFGTGLPLQRQRQRAGGTPALRIRTSTRTRETSSVGGPSRHSATLSRMPFFISLKGRREVSRTIFWTPSTPSISPRALKTSVMPSVYRTTRSPALRSTSRVASASTASGRAPRTMLRDSSSRGSAPSCAIMAGGCPAPAKTMRRPGRSMRAAATVKKKTELPMLCMTKRLSWVSMASRAEPARNCGIISVYMRLATRA